MKISYNSRTNGIFSFNGEDSTEINGGDRPKRPNSEDTQGGDVYTIIFEAKGKFIKTYIDGKLLVETKDKSYKNRRLGLGDRDSTLFTIILRSMALA